MLLARSKTKKIKNFFTPGVWIFQFARRPGLQCTLLRSRAHDPISTTTNAEVEKVCKFVYPHVGCGCRFISKRNVLVNSQITMWMEQWIWMGENYVVSRWSMLQKVPQWGTWLNGKVLTTSTTPGNREITYTPKLFGILNCRQVST